jgi:ubiquinone biosynthesis protein Coq4
LRAVTKAVTDVDIDYRALDPLGPEEFAAVLARRGQQYRQRLVHHMVLAEMVLAPIPEEVAQRVAGAAEALGIKDDFVGIARKYARGTLGLAWNDLRRNGFTERCDVSDQTTLHSKAACEDPWEEAPTDPALTARWEAFADLPEGTLGRAVSRMYRDRGFQLPGTEGSASAYLAQHDFVHLLGDYGTTIEGELEVFAFVGRADPDPKGFAWLATMIGLFETGHIHAQGFFEVDVRDRHLDNPGMDVRLADAIRRGKVVAEHFGKDLFKVDYHALSAKPIDEIRDILHIPPKSADAVSARSPGPFDPDGMSEFQREAGRQLAQQHVKT